MQRNAAQTVLLFRLMAQSYQPVPSIQATGISLGIGLEFCVNGPHSLIGFTLCFLGENRYCEISRFWVREDFSMNSYWV